MITIQREKWSDFKHDIMPLAEVSHGFVEQEIYQQSLDLDHELFEELDQSDTLHCLVMRKDGRAIGYHLVIFAPLLRFKGKWHAYSDSIFVHLDERKHSMQLIQYSEDYIKKLGCMSWVLASLDPQERGKLWQRKGFKKAETIYIKVM